MELHETKKFLHNKRNDHQIKEPTEWEKIFAGYTSWDGINNQNIQEAQKLSSQKHQRPNEEMGK
jgi:hypothetical protein